MNRTTPIRFLIVGAGEAGRMAVAEMRRHPDVGFEAMAFIDDDPAKVGRDVDGLPVFGGRADIPRAVRDLSIDEILIALPSADGAAIRGIVDYCQTERLRFRIVPGIWEIIRGDVHIQQIRAVRPEDLLGRESVEPDLALVAGAFAGRRLLVTGAGGSIGSEICRQLLPAGPERLILLGRGENSIFEAEATLREVAEDPRLEVVIGDVRDHRLMEELIASFKPHVVFHAAAHKHVWLMEKHPREAVLNNFVATARLIDACRAGGVERFVLVSTDKAVHPRSVMGATKRLAEIYLLERAAAAGPGETRLMAVRFGNVLGSRGSVVPIFQRQIARGGPVTVSDPGAERYFMTVKEAALLVVEAGAVGEGGEIFILDMGNQVPIQALARELIVLSGFRPDADIPILFTGMKPGEKMREELVHPFETLTATRVPGLRLTRDLPAGRPLLTGTPLEHWEKIARTQPPAALIEAIEAAVPEAALVRRPAPKAVR